MEEFELVNNFFSKLSKHNVSALGLNDDVFFDKPKKTVISVDTYNINTHFVDFESPDLVIKKINSNYSFTTILDQNIFREIIYRLEGDNSIDLNYHHISMLNYLIENPQSLSLLFLLVHL